MIPIKAPKPLLTKKRLLALSVCVLVLLVILLIPMMGTPTGEAPHEPEPLQGWYQIQDGACVPVWLPNHIEMDADGSLTLYNNFADDKAAGLMLYTTAAVYNLSISLDGETLYAYSDELFPRNDQMKGKLLCGAILPDSLVGRTLCLRYEGSGTESIPAVYIASSDAVFRKQLTSSLPMLCIVTFMVTTALCSLLVAAFFSLSHMPERNPLNLALFLLLCSLWVVTDSPLLLLYSQHIAPAFMISFFAFMLFPAPMVQFVRNFGEMRRYVALERFILLLYLNAIVQGLLCALRLFSMIQMLYVTHLLFLACALTCIECLRREYLRKKSTEIRAILTAFSLLGGSGLLAMLLYWLFTISYYDLIFEFGIVAFSFVLFIEMLRTVVLKYRTHTEAEVYKRLAHEDQLTGIGNRRAFDEYVDNFEAYTTCDDAALLFFDINDLKEVNDTYGHQVGDDLIISASRCLTRVFGQKGKCFRLGGDEFCVVLVDPKDTEAQWFGALERELHMANRKSTQPLSMAKGASFLRNADGTTKTPNEWRTEADRKMYANKASQQNKKS